MEDRDVAASVRQRRLILEKSKSGLELSGIYGFLIYPHFHTMAMQVQYMYAGENPTYLEEGKAKEIDGQGRSMLTTIAKENSWPFQPRFKINNEKCSDVCDPCPMLGTVIRTYEIKYGVTTQLSEQTPHFLRYAFIKLDKRLMNMKRGEQSSHIARMCGRFTPAGKPCPSYIDELSDTYGMWYVGHKPIYFDGEVVQCMILVACSEENINAAAIKLTTKLNGIIANQFRKRESPAVREVHRVLREQPAFKLDDAAFPALVAV